MICPSVPRMEPQGRPTVTDVFVAEVEAFLECTGMDPGAFGREAVDDPGFVRRLRAGRTTTLEAVDRVAAFIESRPRDGGGGVRFSGPDRLRDRISRGWRLRWVEDEEEDARPPAVRILRLSQVLARTGLSRSTLYELMAEGSFPGPIELHAGAVGWFEAEVHAWIRRRVAESRGGAGGPVRRDGA